MTVSPPPPTSLRDRALRGTARGGLLNLMGAAVAGVGGLIVTWLVAYGLGPTTAGRFFAATSAFLVAVSIARLGTPTGLIYWVARCRNDPSAVARVLRSALLPAAVASIAIGVLAFWAAPHLALWHGDGEQQYITMLRALAIFLPAAVAMEALLAATRGFQRMRATVVVEKLGRTVAQLFLLWVAVSWTTTLDTGVVVTAAWAVPYLPAGIVAGLWLRRLHTERRAASGGPPTVITPGLFWAYTAPRAVAGAAHLLLQRMDILLVAGLLGFAEAALYTVATRFVTVVRLISGAVGPAVQPRLATSMSSADHLTSGALYQVTTGWIVVTGWPILLSVGWTAPVYLGLFGAEYVTADGEIVVWLLVCGMLVATVCGVVDSVLVMAGRTGWQLYNVVAALIVNLVLNVWLIPDLGIIGAAIAWTVSLAVNNIVPLVQLRTGLGLHPAGRGTAVAVALSAGWFGVLPALTVLFLGRDAVVAGLAAAGVGMAASAWRLRKTLILPSYQ